jgi:hypothetical protein
MTIVRLVAAEISIILLSSAVFCGAGISLVNLFASDLVRTLFIR